MTRLLALSVACLLLLSPLQAADKPADKTTPKPTAEQLTFFEKKIRPLLVSKCYGCHSAKAKSVKGELLLDSRQGWSKGGESGPAEPDQSCGARTATHRGRRGERSKG